MSVSSSEILAFVVKPIEAACGPFPDQLAAVELFHFALKRCSSAECRAATLRLLADWSHRGRPKPADLVDVLRRNSPVRTVGPASAWQEAAQRSAAAIQADLIREYGEQRYADARALIDRLEMARSWNQLRWVLEKFDALATAVRAGGAG